MGPNSFLGEATEYDKKQAVEKKKSQKLAKKCKCICKHCWWHIDFWNCR